MYHVFTANEIQDEMDDPENKDRYERLKKRLEDIEDGERECKKTVGECLRDSDMGTYEDIGKALRNCREKKAEEERIQDRGEDRGDSGSSSGSGRGGSRGRSRSRGGGSKKSKS